MESTRQQYERFPYPPIPVFALPQRHQGRSLAYETGNRHEESHAGIRILVAGCGTFEPLVVAMQHPMAREIVAVDLSAKSISVLERRLRLARVLRPFTRMAPVRAVAADLFEWAPDGPDSNGAFDYILASNMLHHVADPAALLARLSGWLKPGGMMRVVTYPCASRVWMRETGRYLRSRGVSAETPQLRERVLEAMSALPARGYGLSSGHPLRSCFVSQPETGTDAGLVDAFLNACENPLRPLEWRAACDRAGLVLVGEAQTETSRSDFLVELEPATASLDAWTRLQILDDLLELCANPVLWLRKAKGAIEVREAPNTNKDFEDFRSELIENLARARELLRPCGVSLEQMLERLRVEVGPRVSAPDEHLSFGSRWFSRAPEQHVLPGLSILDYPDLLADPRTS